MASRPNQLFVDSDYVSDYDFGSDTTSETDKDLSDRGSVSDDEMYKKPKIVKSRIAAARAKREQHLEDHRDKESYAQRGHLLSMDAFTRHKKLVNDFLVLYGGHWKDFKRDESGDKRDLDVIMENQRFLWTDNDEPDSWGSRLAKRYWEKLFKEYCIVDLSKYKDNKIGMRWRLEKEVIAGKGQFICGNSKCEEKEDLKSWEVNFGYMEHGEKRNALVKVRLCPECSTMLNYHHRRKEVTKHPRKRHNSNILDDEIVDKLPRLSDSRESSASSSPCQELSLTKIITTTDPVTINPDNVWKESVSLPTEKSRDVEFSEYFEDMFL